jgi:hypothetical protein
MRNAPELDTLNRIARDTRNIAPPTDGISSSAEAISQAIDNIAMQTINSCAIRASQFHLKTHDMVNAVVARIQGTPTK